MSICGGDFFDPYHPSVNPKVEPSTLTDRAVCPKSSNEDRFVDVLIKHMLSDISPSDNAYKLRYGTAVVLATAFVKEHARVVKVISNLKGESISDDDIIAVYQHIKLIETLNFNKGREYEKVQISLEKQKEVWHG